MGFIAPTWAGVQIVDDPYSNAKKGEHILTAVMMTAFVFADTSAYRQTRIQGRVIDGNRDPA